MKVNKQIFLNTIKECMPGVDSSNGLLEGADTLIFEKKWVHSYNDNISVSVPTEWTELTGAVKASELYVICSKMKGEELDVSCTDKAFTIKSGKATVEMTLLEKTIKTHISEVLKAIDKWTELPEDFQQACETCKFVNNTSAIAGVFVRGDIVAGTDEKRINRWKMKGEMDQFWISDIVVSEMLKLKDLREYSLSQSWLHIKTDTGTFFSCKRMDDQKWPIDKFEEILNAHKPKKSDLKNKMPMEVLEAVERATALYTDISGFQAVQLTIGQSDIEVYSANSAGKYEEKVDWETPFAKEFKEFKIYVDLSLIKYACSRSADFYIKITEDEETKKAYIRLLFVSDNFIHLMTTIDG